MMRAFTRRIAAGRVAVPSGPASALHLGVSATMLGVSATMRGLHALHMPGKCPFMTLGLPKTATRTEVKAKYKYLAKTEHPDCGGTEERFKEIHAAFTECNRLIGERELDQKYGSASTAQPQEHGESTTSQGHRETRYDYNDGFNEQKVRADVDRRERLCDMFKTTKTADEVDELLQHCLQSHVFDAVDIGWPLLRALGQYQLCMHLGIDHVKRCFAAINRWEEWHHKQAPQSYYHPLLVLYSDTAAAATNEMSDISEGVTAILEEIEAKGLIPDDWSVSLAQRVFRTSPHAW